MKSTKCFTEITNQKAEKYLSERGQLESPYLLAFSPARLVSTKKFSA